MEFDLPRTLVLFLALVVVGVGGLAASGVMGTRTVLLMVAPTTLVYGLVCLWLGVKHGEYRARRA